MADEAWQYIASTSYEKRIVPTHRMDEGFLALTLLGFNDIGSRQADVRLCAYPYHQKGRGSSHIWSGATFTRPFATGARAACNDAQRAVLACGQLPGGAAPAPPCRPGLPPSRSHSSCLTRRKPPSPDWEPWPRIQTATHFARGLSAHRGAVEVREDASEQYDPISWACSAPEPHQTGWQRTSENPRGRPRPYPYWTLALEYRRLSRMTGMLNRAASVRVAPGFSPLVKIGEQLGRSQHPVSLPTSSMRQG